MKENKKLISEILADVRHDMTDEEILNLLASSRVSVNLSLIHISEPTRP